MCIDERGHCAHCRGVSLSRFLDFLLFRRFSESGDNNPPCTPRSQQRIPVGVTRGKQAAMRWKQIEKGEEGCAHIAK